MSKTNKMILLAALVILLLVWYFSDAAILKKKGELNSGIYDLTQFNTSPNQVVILGCTDPSAVNYNPDATSDNGTCYTIAGCCDVAATNYNPEADSCNISGNNAALCDYGQGVRGKIPCSNTGSCDFSNMSSLKKMAAKMNSKCCGTIARLPFVYDYNV